jgi:hypothetical protein
MRRRINDGGKTAEKHQVLHIRAKEKKLTTRHEKKSRERCFHSSEGGWFGAVCVEDNIWFLQR